MAKIQTSNKRGLEEEASHFLWRKLGWSTIRAATGKGILIKFDDFCKALAEFARERRSR